MALDSYLSLAFWSGLAQIVLIDILLGGDNAVIIALAARRLPAEQRRKAVLWGTFGAVLMRIGLVVGALSLLTLPGLRLVAAVLLMWIGARLMQIDGDSEHSVKPATTLLSAIRTVLVADFVMSLDNVLALAGAAHDAGAHSRVLVVLGLALSVPIVIWGSHAVARLMDRFPVVVTLGAMLMGWIGGGLAVDDPLLAGTVLYGVHKPAGAVGAVAVLALGLLERTRHARRARRRHHAPRPENPHG